jgi:hypothetical protein
VKKFSLRLDILKEDEQHLYPQTNLRRKSPTIVTELFA